jgi:hypothetical protein
MRVSAETYCENFHEPFRLKRYGRDRGGRCDLGAFTLSAEECDSSRAEPSFGFWQTVGDRQGPAP